MDEPPCIYLSAETDELAAWLEEAAYVFEREGFQPVYRPAQVSPGDARRLMEKSVAWIFAGHGVPRGTEEGSPGLAAFECAEAARLGLKLHLISPVRGSDRPMEEPPVTVNGHSLAVSRVVFAAGNKNDAFIAFDYVAGCLRGIWDELLNKTPCHLPPAALHFTGRAADVAWLEGKLRAARPGARFSLIGTGGTGKTAVAREAMARVTDFFPGGVYLHDFYAAPSLAAFMNSILGEGHETWEQEYRDDMLHNKLSSERVLIYAEGVEKLREVPGGTTLKEVFQACGRAVVLITSRHPLDEWQTESRWIGGLPAAEATALLCAHAHNDDSSQDAASAVWEELASLLGCQPLALTLAGSLLRHPDSRPEDYASTLREAGLGSVAEEHRPVEALRYLFRHHAESLPLVAREAWLVLSLHGMCPVRLETASACLGVAESQAREALEVLVARGLALAVELPHQPCHPVEWGWRLAHPRMGEWGRSRLVDSGVDAAAIAGRWRSHWLSWLKERYRCGGLEGNGPWMAFMAAHLRSFLAGLTRSYGADETLQEATWLSACLCLGARLQADALFFADQAATLSVQLYGPDHLTTLLCRIGHAEAMEEAGRGHGIAIIEHCLRKVTAVAGPEHPVAMQGRTALAWLKLTREEKHEDEQAMALLEENERIAASDDAGVRDEHLFSWQCRVQYLLTRAQPEYGAAILKLAEMDGAQSGDGCLIHPDWLADAAGQCLQQKDNLAALALYRRQEERLLHFPPSNEALYIVRYNIVNVLGMLERWEEAETEARGLVEFTTGFGADAGVYGKAAASLLEKTCRREPHPAEEEEDAP